jgi:hypothetical protein
MASVVKAGKVVKRYPYTDAGQREAAAHARRIGGKVVQAGAQGSQLGGKRSTAQSPAFRARPKPYRSR